MQLPRKLLPKKLRDYLQNEDEVQQWKDIGRISGPAFVELVLVSLFNMVDLVMLGRVSSVYIAAAGLSNHPAMLLVAVFQAINVGATTLVAWNIGARDMKEANKIAAQVVMFNAIFGIVIMAVGLMISGAAISFMGSTEETHELAVQYFELIIYSIPFMAIGMSITASLRGAGETKIPMFYNLICGFLNVLGNYVLIYGKLGFPELGVLGAGLSTAICRGIGAVMAFCVLFFNKNCIIRPKLIYCLHVNFRRIMDIVKIGIPSAAEQFVIQGGLILYTRAVSGLGTAMYSAHIIGLNLCGLTFSPSMAFGIAATTMVGTNLGAGKPDVAEIYMKKIRIAANVVACCIGLVFLFFSTQLAMIYTTDMEVARMTGIVLKIMAFAQMGQSTQLTMAGALRGAGDTMYPLYASVCGIWGFRVVTTHIVVNIMGLGLIGAWCCLFLDQYMRATVVFLRFRSGKWKTAKLKKRQPKTKQA